MMTPGIYQMTAEAYHADPCPEPSLSSGLVRTLLMDSALHAFYEHPRLSPERHAEESEAFDVGTAAHAYLLEGEQNFIIIEARDYRTKVAQELRDAARAAGKVPILAHRMADVTQMAIVARHQLVTHAARPTPFTNGQPEQTLIWQEGQVWCRARCDWLHETHRVIDDYKTTGASANPEVWTRSLFNSGFDLQAAWYLRGLRAITGEPADFRFVVQETYTPYALSVIALAPDALELAARKTRRAIELWDWCLSHKAFPGYPADVCYADMPPWHEAQWMEREIREAQQ